MKDSYVIDGNRGLSAKLFRGDIPRRVLEKAYGSDIVAWDIETSGLDWRTARIATCQLYIQGAEPAIIQIGDTVPRRLKMLLENASIRKVFHHAMFDLRFMAVAWNAQPQNIACTKIAAKLADRENQHEHSLKAIVQQYLGVTLDKAEQMSDWLSESLTMNQIEYAARDVIYLPELMGALEQRLEPQGLLPLARQCFAHIPTRVQLDVLGYSDVYNY